MSEVYDSLMEGLNEALAFARGEATGAVVHHIAVPEVDVAAIRSFKDEIFNVFGHAGDIPQDC